MQHPFPHERLDVYHRSLDLASLAHEICAGLPRGYAHLKDQLMRSSSAISCLIGEGASRYSSAQKKQRFMEAQGECGEAAATVEVLSRYRVITKAQYEAFRALSSRIGAMLTGLIKRFS